MLVSGRLLMQSEKGTFMATPEILNFETLLAPIGDADGVGVDLRSDSELTAVYYQIRDARSAARSAERQAIRDGEDLPKMVDEWRAVIDQGSEVLANTSKNLEIAAWMIEALLRRNGFAGLRDGCRLARELIETYWDEIFPLPDEDGVRTRVAALAGLNGEDGPGTLDEPLINMEICEAGPYGAFRVWQYKQAREINAMTDEEERQRRIDAGAPSFEQVEEAIRGTNIEFYRDMIDDIADSIEEYAKFCEVIEAKCEDFYFPTSNITNHVKEIQELVKLITRDIIPEEVELDDAEGDGEAGSSAKKAKSAGVSGGPVTNRAEALKTLLEVSNFFIRTEPHSPISYTLKQAVRWAQMPLPRLLTELIPDETARGGYFRLVGISETDENASTIGVDDGYDEIQQEVLPSDGE